MKRLIRSSVDHPIKVEVVYESITSGRIEDKVYEGATLSEALANMCVNMIVYADEQYFEEYYEMYGEPIDAEDILRRLERTNGDGCDYIITLTDLSTGINLIDNEDYFEDEGYYAG